MSTQTAISTSLGVATRPQGSRRDDIQGLRAIAVLMVVLFHVGLPLPGGFAGVDVFFVISGYVITAMLAREFAAHGRIRFARFYVRRFKRLTPALAVMLGFTLIASMVLIEPFKQQVMVAEIAIGAIALAANFVIAATTGGYFAAPAETNPLLNTWSLSVEEQFYLAFPLLLGLAWTGAAARRWRHLPLTLVAVASVASFALALVGTETAEPSRVEWLLGFYSPLTRIWEFGVGAALALMPAVTARIPRALAGAAGVTGAVLLAITLVAVEGSFRYPGPVTLVPVIGTALLLVAGTHGDLATSRGLSAPALVRIGDWSYSIYLWHWPFIVFAGLLFPGEGWVLAAAVVLSMVPALASYRWVEQPIRELPMPTPTGLVRMVALTVVPVLLLAGVLFLGGRSGWGLAWPDQYPKTWDSAAAGLTACPEGALGAGVEIPGSCVEPARAEGIVLVLGDSQALTEYAGVASAAAQEGLRTALWAKHGCPFGAREVTGGQGFNCGEWQGYALAYALELRPDAVVIANRSAGYIDPGTGWITFYDGAGRPADSQAEALVLYEEALTGVVEPLTAAGIPVLIVHTIPEPERVDNQVSLLRRVWPVRTPGTWDATATLAARAPAVVVERELAARFPGVGVYDPAPALCEGERCTLRDGTAWWFNDRTHVSVDGALTLVPSLSDALGGLLATPRG